MAGPELAEAAWTAWREEVRFVDNAPNPEVTSAYEQGIISLREVMVHMIEEYARHADHADLLRERIDGRVGQ